MTKIAEDLKTLVKYLKKFRDIQKEDEEPFREMARRHGVDLGDDWSLILPDSYMNRIDVPETLSGRISFSNIISGNTLVFLDRGRIMARYLF